MHLLAGKELSIGRWQRTPLSLWALRCQIERICEGNKPASWVREAISAMKSKLVARPSCRETNTKFQWEIDGDVKTMRSLRCTKAIAAMMLTMSLFGLTICDAQAQAQPQDQNGAQMARLHGPGERTRRHETRNRATQSGTQESRGYGAGNIDTGRRSKLGACHGVRDYTSAYPDDGKC